MTSIVIKGHNVSFPYETPYDLQKVYMEKVLTCLDDGRHGVLESPTGTGKTLCLFAPVAAWAKEQKPLREESIETETFCSPKKPSFSTRKSQNKKGTKVWYTSRTHSQIAQTITEVRRCNIENLDIRVVGSRDQLCINEEVLQEKEAYVKIVKCKGLVKERQCVYYRRLQQEKDRDEDLNKFYASGEVLDIEDLVSIGKTHGVCPYFMSKDAVEKADVVLLPYNYIIDTDSRDGLNVNKDIVIFDEGHNVPAKCEESYEFTLTSIDLASGIKSVQSLVDGLYKWLMRSDDSEIDLNLHLKNAQFILGILKNLDIEMARLGTSNELKPIESLYDFFQRAGIQTESSLNILAAISAFKDDAQSLNLLGDVISIFHLLEKMLTITFGLTIKLFDQETIDRSFKYGITVDKEFVKVKSKKISLFCFNPSFGIQTLLNLGVKSIIITSGTLSPLKNFIYELGLPDPVTLENDHIAKKCQVPFVILGTGVNNVKMDSAFKNRDDPNYIFSLGMTLTNLISSIPDGVLMLFGSYVMLEKLKEAWESNIGIWSRLNNLKRVFIEPRGKEEFINCMENYKRAIDSGNGAILLGVLRGKISEGMDFKDQYCRGVFIIGVPYPPVKDPRVQGKRSYSEELTYYNPDKKAYEKLFNNSYFAVEAMKVTNQAIGRVIRHARDYGAIILVDHRFADSNLLFGLSAWLRRGRPTPKNFPETKKLLREFFRDVHSGKMDIEEIRRQRVDENGCPIAENIKFEEYDHRTAVRNIAHNQCSSYSSSTTTTTGTATVVVGAARKAKTATLAYRNTFGKSTVMYEDDSSSDSENTVCSLTPQNTECSKYEEEDIAIISAMDELESPIKDQKLNMADSPMKDIKYYKRKHLGEENENPTCLTKSPCLGRRNQFI